MELDVELTLQQRELEEGEAGDDEDIFEVDVLVTSSEEVPPPDAMRAPWCRKAAMRPSLTPSPALAAPCVPEHPAALACCRPRRCARMRTSST